MTASPSSSFEDYIRGKSVALVGPAVAPYDQSAEVEAHDVVYRIGYRWDLNKPIPNYGERTDVVFYNAENSRKLALGLYDTFVKDIPWVMVKRDPKLTKKHPYRVLELPFTKANQAPIALHDLVKLAPSKITVFGVDLYMDGPTTAYDKNYLDRTPERDWWGIEIHDPRENHKFIHQLLRNYRELIVGDNRFMAVAQMSTKHYMENLARAWNV
jgi:hypothetical protein